MTELVRTYKITDSGAWGWETEEASGGGGSLPSWWTVDSTPGSESVEFAGAVTIAPSDPAVAAALKVVGPLDFQAFLYDDGVAEYASLGKFGVGVYGPDAGITVYDDYNASDPVFQVFAGTGAVTISPSDATANKVLELNSPSTSSDGYQVIKVTNDDSNEILSLFADGSLQVSRGGDGTASLQVTSNGYVIVAPSPGDGGRIGFYGGTAVVQPTGVAVTAGGIHAALVTLNLIAA